MSAPALRDPYPIVPFDGPINAVVTVPGSKSITNRALLCAALAVGATRLTGVLQADDTDAMLDCVAALGAHVEVDPADPTAVTVTGVGGAWRHGPLSVNARMSGTTARFIAPSLVLGSGGYTLDATESMRERPMGDLLAAIEAMGGRVEAREGGRLPLTVLPVLPVPSVLPADGAVHGEPVELLVPGNVSSQFLSGLLLTAPCLPCGARIRCEGELVSRPYVDMTIAVMQSFGATVAESEPGIFVVDPVGYGTAGHYAVEPDASAASYPLAAAAITGGTVTIPGLHAGSLQGDLRFASILGDMGADVSVGTESTTVRGRPLRGVTVDMADCSDTAQTLAVVAAFADGPTTVTGIQSSRKKETDRLSAVVAELTRCGVRAVEHLDGFTIYPGPVQPAVVETYRDHRMAMSFALLGLRSPGVAIADPGCVAKTFPDYFTVFESMRPLAPTGSADHGARP